MSEKVPISVSFVAAFVTGFIIAYVQEWRLALALSSILPCIGITGAIMNKLVSKYMQCVSTQTKLPPSPEISNASSLFPPMQKLP
jgi:ABC-type multidrug transport system fused ATPase/permease subunit